MGDKAYMIPATVQRNAQRGLDLREKYGRGGTIVGVTMAKRLAYGAWLDYDYVKKVSEYFPRHQHDNLEQKNPPSNGYIAWLLWGGTTGWIWSNTIVRNEREEG